MKKVLTIAGSDSSGGAGIQADLRTFQKLGVYGMTALTVIVAMDPHENWKHLVFPVDVDIIKSQIATIAAGIGVDAMKTGMLPTTDIIELAAHTVKKHSIKNVVIDPVMVCKGAGEPLHPENAECFRRNLVPLATVVTPNIFEASQLSGLPTVATISDMKEAARIIKDLGADFVVVKGGNDIEHKNSIDVVYDGTTFELLEAETIDTTYTHGAGCTFSATIAAELAKGSGTLEAISNAKRYVTDAIKNSFRLNRFVGPVGLPRQIRD